MRHIHTDRERKSDAQKHAGHDSGVFVEAPLSSTVSKAQHSTAEAQSTDRTQSKTTAEQWLLSRPHSPFAACPQHLYISALKPHIFSIQAGVGGTGWIALFNQLGKCSSS